MNNENLELIKKYRQNAKRIRELGNEINACENKINHLQNKLNELENIINNITTTQQGEQQEVKFDLDAFLADL